MTRADVQRMAPTRTFEERNALGVIAEAHTFELHCGSVQQPARGQSQRQLLVLVQVRQVVLNLLACTTVSSPPTRISRGELPST